MSNIEPVEFVNIHIQRIPLLKTSHVNVSGVGCIKNIRCTFRRKLGLSLGKIKLNPRSR